ncbi:unnamed protein product [Rangifer tarandus platyrhynchus]|uniref:Uncharacterized protein n=2 Tax=Rangifer tarandus platyrhynchus TaxID=3082113 RepID=A0AC59Y297_RANTA|nr:unnamed protein product [Rangifer tarandus platyrhynchus]
MGLIADLESVQLCPRSSLELLVASLSKFLLANPALRRERWSGQARKGGAAVDPHCHTNSLAAPVPTGCLRPSPRVEVGSCEAQPLACSQLCFPFLVSDSRRRITVLSSSKDITEINMHMHHESSFV